jgi:hypothetical protein
MESEHPNRSFYCVDNDKEISNTLPATTTRRRHHTDANGFKLNRIQEKKKEKREGIEMCAKRAHAKHTLKKREQ